MLWFVFSLSSDASRDLTWQLQLALSDMVVCVLAQPMYIAHIQTSSNLSSVLQITRKTITWFAVIASLNNIFFISLDRSLAVTFQQRYRVVMTHMSLKVVFGAT